MKISIPLFFIMCSFLPQLKAEHKIIEIEEALNFNEPWYKKDRTDEDNFKRLISGLNKTISGKKVIDKATEKAAQKGFTLYDVIGIGDGSLTDTTLIRRFAANDPSQVVYETKSKVFLNRRLKTLDALLDFAHELTHYTYREAFNPYNHHFALKDFIRGTVEGRGGEVDAYMVECQVLFELLPGIAAERSNCQKVFDKKLGVISKEMGVHEFYKVGSHFGNFKKEIEKFSLNEKDLPEASEGEALFISSAWGLPYPVAAVKEYTNIMDRVCKNDQNRLTLMQNKITRGPASKNDVALGKNESDIVYKNMFEDFKIRCDKFSSN
ncbi:MAG: hypothetical protein Q7U04_15090 [Bacteriovorax sp.]|nr:hypothetical protein [Bacteriovorax sp.]